MEPPELIILPPVVAVLVVMEVAAVVLRMGQAGTLKEEIGP